MSLQAQKDLLLLSRAPSLGPTRLRMLLSRFQTPEKILNASLTELSRAPRIGQATAEAILKFLHGKERATVEAQIERQFEQLSKLNASLITILDEAYPARLKEISDAPVCLFVRGALRAEDSKCLAIVGTRYPTDYGKNVARKFSSAIARSGFTIVSGLAFGIDSVAHSAALEAGGRTIAVLGSGIDAIYTDPKGKLYPKILENGAILSEEWIGVAPVAENFPKRNRIISGLSLGVLIVESDFRGGAMITAKYAIEQNRDVFAVPGSVFSPKSNGANALIRDSQAKLVLSPDDVINEYPEHRAKPTTLVEQMDAVPELSDEERKIYALLTSEPIHIDDLAEKSGLDVSDVLVALFELEMKNVARQLAGKMFQRV
ncbi:MAG: DNA-processing protein DprA [Chloroherpetonaceae bacterium]|nr:DNA-processing protein DprA [Chloroherpetonaceae bacterium]